MRSLSTNIPAFIVAVLVTYSAAAPLLTQLNLAAITALGYEVPVPLRLITTLQDFLGLLSLYAPVLAFSLCLAFVFTHFVLGRLMQQSLFLYALAGFTGVAAAHLAMNAVFGLIVVAPVRSFTGLLSQAFAGALGGAAFWIFRRYILKRHNKQ